jgi:hypothetical protein
MSDTDKSLVNNKEITDNVLACLKFAVVATREAGGSKEIGIKGYRFTEKEFTAEANELVKIGYFSRQMIFADRSDNNSQCNLAGEQGTKNISGLYYAVTEEGLRAYLNNIQK